jgi:protein TonB
VNSRLRTIEKLKKPVAVFLLLSLFVHAAVLLVFFVVPAVQKAVKPETVQVEYLPADELAPPTAEEHPKRKTKSEKLRDQIVEQQKQLNDETPEDSRFLSAFNQKVVKQTRAELNDKFNNTAQGGQPDEGQKDGEKNADDKTAKTERHKRNREAGELPDLRDLMPKYSLTPGPKAPKMDENGNPSATDDHLKDVQSGLQTLLSTREFVYYAYYARIKDALRQHWEPNVREKVKIIYRQGRTIASAQDRVTQVMVTLNKNGELIKVEVITQSGVESLDGAAVDAFREAAPFPNPPKGMVESDGTVKIRWDFVLEA